MVVVLCLCAAVCLRSDSQNDEHGKYAGANNGLGKSTEMSHYNQPARNDDDKECGPEFTV